MEHSDINKAVDKLYEDYYFSKVRTWAESMGLPGDMTARRILMTPTRPENVCRGKMANGDRCTRKAKKNGFCGYHKKQFVEAPQRQINWNRPAPRAQLPDNLIIP